MNIDSIISSVTERISTETVVGEVIDVDGVKLIPILNVSFGFGGGSGDDKSSKDPGSGSGGGGGARMKVSGVLVIKDGDVKFIQTGRGGAFDKLMDSIPELVDKVKAAVDKSGNTGASDGESSAETTD